MKANKVVIKSVDNKFYVDIFQNRSLDGGEFLTSHSFIRDSFETIVGARESSLKYLTSIGNKIEDIEIITE